MAFSSQTMTMKLIDLWRDLWKEKESEFAVEPPLGDDEDPFDKAVVEEYLIEARARRFRYVRIIHGKGIGAQREMVRKILDRTPFVILYHDAAPEAGGLGATIAELDLEKHG